MLNLNHRFKRRAPRVASRAQPNDPTMTPEWTPEFVPFLRFDREIRTVICTTNAIESINARLRRAVNARGHFPTEQAAMKCLYLAIMSLDPTGRGRQRWSNRWKAALNAFDMTFDGRLSAGRK
jgi:putative transposase